MPRIRCLYMDCNFLDDNYCTAPTVEIDPDLGCSTYLPLGEADLVDDDEWEDEDEDFAGWNTEDIDDDFDDADDDEEEDW